MCWPSLPEAQPLGDPPAGQGFTYIPEDAGGERLEAVTFELATSGTAGNRAALLSILDNSGAVLAQAAAPFTLSASKTSLYSFFRGGAQYGANDAANIGGPLPAFLLSRNWTLAVTVGNMKPADQISAVRLVVSRCEEGDDDAEG